MSLHPAVFLDRDGTLMDEVHYCADPALVRIFPGAAAALRRLNECGYLCVIITNQSGIGRGLLTEAQYHAVQAELLRQLEEQGSAAKEAMEPIGPMRPMSPIGPMQPASHTHPLIAASYFCPDVIPSLRRKPEPGMVLEARDLGIDLARSWFVGDKAADIACGAGVGARTILVQTGYGAKTAAKLLDLAPDFIVKDIAEAAEVVLQNSDAHR